MSNVSGVPRLHLDSLGSSRNTPRRKGFGVGTPPTAAAAQARFRSSQPAAKRPYEESSDDERGRGFPDSRSVNYRMHGSTPPYSTPRATRDEIERRRRVMFDSDDEDSPVVRRSPNSRTSVPRPSRAMNQKFWGTDDDGDQPDVEVNRRSHGSSRAPLPTSSQSMRTTPRSKYSSWAPGQAGPIPDPASAPKWRGPSPARSASADSRPRDAGSLRSSNLRAPSPTMRAPSPSVRAPSPARGGTPALMPPDAIHSARSQASPRNYPAQSQNGWSVQLSHRGGGEPSRPPRQESDTDSDLDDIAARHARNFLADSSPPHGRTSPSTASTLRRRSPSPPSALARSSGPRGGSLEGRIAANSLVSRARSPARGGDDAVYDKMSAMEKEVKSLKGIVTEQERVHGLHMLQVQHAQSQALEEVRALRATVESLQGMIQSLSSGDGAKSAGLGERQIRFQPHAIVSADVVLDDGALVHPIGMGTTGRDREKHEELMTRGPSLGRSGSSATKEREAKEREAKEREARDREAREREARDREMRERETERARERERELEKELEREREREREAERARDREREAEREREREREIERVRERERDAERERQRERERATEREREAERERDRQRQRDAEARKEDPAAPPDAALPPTYGKAAGTPMMGRRDVTPKTAGTPNADAPPDMQGSTIKTPAVKVGRVNKSVLVQRQPIPGAQAVTDRVGIGISFGMTAKGDVFITGMAPNGPAKSSGQIKRGDQLLAVDGTEIKTWDVKDIVGLIVGPPGSFVRLDVLAAPESARNSPSPTR